MHKTMVTRVRFLVAFSHHGNWSKKPHSQEGEGAGQVLCAFKGGESKCSRIIKLITLFEVLSTD